ncbi:MAG TPA: dicarboxylate/amino acid:cation symporter [Casimicrobiaceae bacterium]|jgi:Na+/H+-dicarboxylate symporter|nr:dicarboxylate/amino acid:cation symporter [Casimicrobiaceae bacterium]
MKNAWGWYRRRSIGTQIFIGMAVGVVVGFWMGPSAERLKPVGDIFIRLLVMAAIPLIFFTLMSGLTTIKEAGFVGRLTARILVYYVVTSIIAFAIAIAVMDWMQPGAGFALKGSVKGEIGQMPSLATVVLDIFPNNIVQAFATGNVTQIVVFGVFLGIAALWLEERYRARVVAFFETGRALFVRLVGIIIAFAPIGLGVLTAYSVGVYGSKIAGPLLKFIGAIYVSEIAMFGVIMVLLYAIARVSPSFFLRRTYPLYFTTAGTTSSLASLAQALQIAEERLHIPRNICGFTLPFGVQFTKDGTGIFLAAILLFAAQSQGQVLPLGTIVVVVLTGLLLATGSGGVPGGGLVVGLVFVKAFGLPIEIAVLIGGIYHILDIGNTTLNVMNDMVATVIASRLERAIRVEHGVILPPDPGLPLEASLPATA